MGWLAYWSVLPSAHQSRHLTYFDKLYWIFFDVGIIGWMGGHCLAMPGGGRGCGGGRWCFGGEERRRKRGGKTPTPVTTPQNSAKFHVRKTNTYLPDLQPIPQRHRNILYPFKKNVILFYRTFGFLDWMGIYLPLFRCEQVL